MIVVVDVLSGVWGAQGKQMILANHTLEQAPCMHAVQTQSYSAKSVIFLKRAAHWSTVTFPPDVKDANAEGSSPLPRIQGDIKK